MNPSRGNADPVGTANGFLASALSGGAAVWRDTPVTRLLTDGDHVVGVETPHASVFAERVVVAAGPWTARLARDVGVELPIRSSRHPVVLFECSAGQRARHVVADAPNQVYLPEGADLLRWCGRQQNNIAQSVASTSGSSYGSVPTVYPPGGFRSSTD